MVVPLSRDANAVLDALGSSLRASREAIIHGVAPLSKGTTIAYKARLVANHFPTRCIHQSYIDGVLVQMGNMIRLGFVRLFA